MKSTQAMTRDAATEELQRRRQNGELPLWLVRNSESKAGGAVVSFCSATDGHVMHFLQYGTSPVIEPYTRCSSFSI